MRLLNGLLLSLLAGCATTASTPAALPGEAVANGVTLIRGVFVQGSQPDGNTVLLRGSNGLIVVDSGRHAAHTMRILEAARGSELQVTGIVNTHWHLDHVAGNAALREAFPQAEVHASNAIDDALAGFLADYRKQLQALIGRDDATPETVGTWQAEIARIDAGAQLRPTHPVTAPQDRSLGGRSVHLGLEDNAVSGGDVWLYDKSTRTLVAGDLVTLPVPLFDTACSEGWQQALARLDATGFSRLVPGHGAPMDHVQFRMYRDGFDRLLSCAASDAPAESCKAGWLRDTAPLIPPQDAVLAGSLLDYYIPQVLRAPPERRARYCRTGNAS
jgi:glyoxylase-like metal-dependent hydrolase (beta-lactamase superfamily II)